MTFKNFTSFVLLFVSLFSFAASAASHSADTEAWLCRLDSVLAKSEVWDSIKRHRLTELHRRARHISSTEEQYRLSANLYEEYYVYNADSAMTYAIRNRDIAQQLGNKAACIEWDINRSFVLSAAGLLKEAQDVIESINSEEIPRELQASYYNQLAYLYSHYNQYLGDDATLNTDYYIQSRAYQDSTYTHALPSDPLYLWYAGWASYKGTDHDRQQMVVRLKAEVDSTTLMDSRIDAMNAYILAHLCNNQGDTESYIKYLAMSAICDVMISNKDIASLEELGKMMLNEGNIDRAYAYVNYCQQQAQSFNNRVRSLTLANTEKAIREEYAKRNNSQQLYLHIFLFVLLALLAFLGLSVVVIVRKNKRLNDSRNRLTNLNHELQASVTELTSLRESQEASNRHLKVMNAQLSDINIQLKESNIIKEEYVGQMFSICSDYINKIEAFRKDVSRKLKVNQIDAIHKMVDSPSLIQSELKEFYHCFDSIFLNIFPDFVKDFNKLLRPDEQITLNDGELLNTPLRIYALVRLGISDSVKIAALLHCSTQTVYNNRLRIRNKAIIPKESFAETVRTLGKHQLF